MFPMKGRNPQLPDEPQKGDALDRRVAAYRVADQEYCSSVRRRQAWTHSLEQPVTLLRWGVVRSLADVSAHRRCFYPKHRVPKRFLPEPNYARIANRVREVKKLLANDANFEHLVRHHVETIHEEEHILQIAEAIRRWDQVLSKQG